MHNLINSLRRDYFYNFILERIGRYIWFSQEVSSLELEEKNSQKTDSIKYCTQVGYCGKKNYLLHHTQYINDKCSQSEVHSHISSENMLHSDVLKLKRTGS